MNRRDSWAEGVCEGAPIKQDLHDGNMVNIKSSEIIKAAKGYTTKEVAERCGITERSFISAIQYGCTSISTLGAICRGLYIAPVDIIIP